MYTPLIEEHCSIITPPSHQWGTITKLNTKLEKVWQWCKKRKKKTRSYPNSDLPYLQTKWDHPNSKPHPKATSNLRLVIRILDWGWINWMTLNLKSPSLSNLKLRLTPNLCYTQIMANQNLSTYRTKTSNNLVFIA